MIEEDKIVEIRRAYYPLIIRIISFFFIIDLIYLIVIIASFNSLGQDYNVSIFALIFLVVKFIIFIIFTIKMTASWTLEYYHIEGNNLIRYRGFYNPQETIFNLKNLYSIDAFSSYLGRVLKYGDIKLTVMNNQDKKETIEINGVVEPFKYRKYFQKYLN